MSGFNGNAVARNVRQGICKVNVSTWSPLHSGLNAGPSGSNIGELPNRQWVKIQPRGSNTIRIAIKYANKNLDGTFTVPTSTAHDAIVYPTTSIIEEPIGDDVRIFARAVQNGGSSGGFKCVVAEYS